MVIIGLLTAPLVLKRLYAGSSGHCLAHFQSLPGQWGINCVRPSRGFWIFNIDQRTNKASVSNVKLRKKKQTKKNACPKCWSALASCAYAFPYLGGWSHSCQYDQGWDQGAHYNRPSRDDLNHQHYHQWSWHSFKEISRPSLFKNPGPLPWVDSSLLAQRWDQGMTLTRSSSRAQVSGNQGSYVLFINQHGTKFFAWYLNILSSS